MNYKISDDRKTLTIRVDEAERQELRELGPLSVAADDYMHDFLEPITCNSELEWVYPEHTGDLTDAPMLGVCDWSNQAKSDTPKILERWAFFPYQTRSVLEDLRDNGLAIFQS